jgi:hypothetical protein
VFFDLRGGAMKVIRTMVLGMLIPAAATGQTTTTALVDPSAAQTMARAAGMPLNDGALEPGMLTVRIVRGAFAGDVAGQPIQLEISGQPGQTLSTQADGRAYFAHLPIGAHVRASAVVDGVTLTSESFTMPADSGVRVLLVVDGDAVGSIDGQPESGGAAPTTTSAGLEGMPVAAGSTAATPPGVTAVRIVLSMLSVFGVVLVVFRKALRAPGTRSG